jgi:hypothetical protein
MTLFKHGALTTIKWPVHTESTLAVERVGLDKLQMLNYYLKLSPLNIIPCWIDYLHVIRSSGLLFVDGFREFTSDTHVSATNFIAMRPAIIDGLRVETVLASFFSAIFLEKSLEFPQLV